MSELREKYFEALGIPDDTKPLPGVLRDKKAGLERALGRAYELRSFEIEHYWKRATYFWGFQIAIFTALGFLWGNDAENGWGLITVALGCLGTLTAFANVFSAQGSKFWQENWESHIDMLEDSIEGRLHKTVWLKDGKPSYSVSKINLRMGWCFVAFWIFITVYVTYKFLDLLGLIQFECACSWILVCAMLAAAAFGFAMLFIAKTDFKDAAVVPAGKDRSFVRRSPPDGPQERDDAP